MQSPRQRSSPKRGCESGCGPAWGSGAVAVIGKRHGPAAQVSGTSDGLANGMNGGQVIGTSDAQATGSTAALVSGTIGARESGMSGEEGCP